MSGSPESTSSLFFLFFFSTGSFFSFYVPRSLYLHYVFLFCIYKHFSSRENHLKLTIFHEEILRFKMTNIFSRSLDREEEYAHTVPDQENDGRKERSVV